MKRFALLITVLLIIGVSCDKIDTSKEVFKTIGPVEVSAWNEDYARTVVQKIYVEEFTAHRCTFCPTGARELKAIMEADPTVIVTAIHCSSLADPLSKPPFNINYKTPMGDVLHKDFNIKDLPKATINRIKNENEWGFGRTEWRKIIENINRNNVRAGIEIQYSVNKSIQEIEAKVSVTIIKEIKNPVQLCIVLQENGIISGQIDNNVNILEYEHNDMIRVGFNGNYGTKLTQNGMVMEQIKYTSTFKLNYENGFSYSNIPAKIDNCNIVAYLLDMETKEVIQVEKIDVKN
ncbi:MAG: Omp28-related outer membrane protein [Bacteroidales bacterium]|jgi:hypothetical protein|nr:Omp28-related outer membrane protein [Bacteroidales bacterium]